MDGKCPAFQMRLADRPHDGDPQQGGPVPLHRLRGIVLDGLDQRRLDAVLSELRRRKVHIPLKAVVTPTNALWTPGELYAELCREREAIARGRPIHE